MLETHLKVQEREVYGIVLSVEYACLIHPGSNTEYGRDSSVLHFTPNLSAHEIFVHRLPLALVKDLGSLDWPSVRLQISVPDLYRDMELLRYLQDQDLTVRQHLANNGLDDVVIVADPRIFETEVRRAKLDLPLGNQVHLSLDHILAAYLRIDADFVISPAGMILDRDRERSRRQKMDEMMSTLDRSLEHFPSRKVMATVQGTSTEEIDRQLDVVEDRGITKVVRGGLLPLRKYNSALHDDVVTYSASQFKQRELFSHVAGVGSVEQVDEFLDYGIDSVDSSFLYYHTKQSRYLSQKGEVIQTEKPPVSTCQCRGCDVLKQSKDHRSAQYAAGLYYHNLAMLNRLIDTSTGSGNRNTDEMQSFSFTTAADLAISSEQALSQAIPGVRSSSNLSVEQIVTSPSRITPVDSHRFEQKYRRERDIQPATDDEQIVALLLQVVLPEVRSSGRVCLISCGTKSKRPWYPGDMVFENASQLRHRDEIASSYQIMRKEAGDLYTGRDHRIISELVRRLSRSHDIDHHIISAGYGLLDPQDRIVSYDCSFVNKSFSEIVLMSIQTRLGADLQHIIDGDYDLIIFNVSHSYQVIKDLVTFVGSSSRIMELKFSNSQKIELVTLSNAE